MLVKEALREYLDENGFKIEEYTKDTFRLKMFGRYFEVRNSKDRQWAIARHDLHHMATGYGTDWVGEAEIGVWELRGGCKTPVVYALNIAAVLIGLVIAPLRMIKAYQDARGAQTMYYCDVSYEQAMELTVGQLREKLGVRAGGLAMNRRLHTDAQVQRDSVQTA